MTIAKEIDVNTVAWPSLEASVTSPATAFDLAQRLRIGKNLGSGSFAVVYRAEYDGKPVALKVLLPQYLPSTRDDCPVKMFLREGDLLRRLDHAHIVRCLAVLELPPSFPGLLRGYMRPTWALVLELLPGGALSSLLYKQLLSPWKFLYDNGTALEWSVQLASALSYLHNSNPPIIHRDIKVENVMLGSRPSAGKRPSAKLVDLGLHSQPLTNNRPNHQPSQPQQQQQRLSPTAPSLLLLRAPMSRRNLPSFSTTPMSNSINRQPTTHKTPCILSPSPPALPGAINSVGPSPVIATTAPQCAQPAGGSTLTACDKTAPGGGGGATQGPSLPPTATGVTGPGCGTGDLESTQPLPRALLPKACSFGCNSGGGDGQGNGGRGNGSLPGDGKNNNTLNVVSSFGPEEHPTLFFATTDGGKTLEALDFTLCEEGDGTRTGARCGVGKLVFRRRISACGVRGMLGSGSQELSALMRKIECETAASAAAAAATTATTIAITDAAPADTECSTLEEGRVRRDALEDGRTSGPAATATQPGTHLMQLPCEELLPTNRNRQRTSGNDVSGGNGLGARCRGLLLAAAVVSESAAGCLPPAYQAGADVSLGGSGGGGEGNNSCVSAPIRAETGIASGEEGHWRSLSTAACLSTYRWGGGGGGGGEDGGGGGGGLEGADGGGVGAGTSRNNLRPKLPLGAKQTSMRSRLPSQALRATSEGGPVCSDLEDWEIAGNSFLEVVFPLTGETGSCMTMAPEIRLQQPYNEKIDVYAFGVLLYELWSRSVLSATHIGTRRRDMPFMLNKCDDWPDLIVSGYRPARVDAIPEPVWQLITECWDADPLARPSMPAVEVRLRRMGDEQVAEVVGPASGKGGRKMLCSSSSGSKAGADRKTAPRDGQCSCVIS